MGGIIKTKFIGKNGSMGFKTGRIYSLRSELGVEKVREPVSSNEVRLVSKSIIKIYDTSSSLECWYSSLPSFLRNWEILK